jgi:biotin transport system substrate-specific component
MTFQTLDPRPMTARTLADVLWPAADQGGAGVLLRNAMLVLVGSIFVAASAQVQVPWYPVPFTGQTFGALVVGLALGWRLGALSLALYWLEGAIGLPVFAGFKGGMAIVSGPTGGYIAGFVLAAGVVGFLAEKGWTRNVLLTLAAMVIGNIAIYACGVTWLANWYATLGAKFIPAGATAFEAAIANGLVPFLLGDAAKIVLAALALPAAWKVVRAMRGAF